MDFVFAKLPFYLVVKVSILFFPHLLDLDNVFFAKLEFFVDLFNSISIETDKAGFCRELKMETFPFYAKSIKKLELIFAP